MKKWKSSKALLDNYKKFVVSVVCREILSYLMSMLGDKVDAVMSSPVITVNEDDLIKTAFYKMEINKISQVPVLRKGKVIGIIYDSSILSKILKGDEDVNSIRAKEIMEQPLIVKTGSLITEVINLLSRNPAVIVVDDDMYPQGIITRSDIIRYKLSRFGFELLSGKSLDS